MSITRAQLRRLERLERARPQPGDVGTCQAPSLESETLRVALRMLVEAGGLQGERFTAVQAALAAAQQEVAGDAGEEGGDENVDEERR